MLNSVWIGMAEGGIWESIKDVIDRFVSPDPTWVFLLSIVGLMAFVYFRKALTTKLAGIIMLVFSTVFLFVSLEDPDFYVNVSKADNVPIVFMLFLLGFFTWLGMRRAVINDELIDAGKPTEEQRDRHRVFTWPDLVYTELICMVVGTVLLIVWSILLEAPIEEPAMPAKTPNPSKAPWYFVGLQEDLIYFDPWIAGVILPGFIILGLMAIPYLDTNPKGNGYYTYKERRFAWIFFVFSFVVLWIVPIMIGTFLRGPNQAIFGPYEWWDPHKLPPIVSVDLADYFWIHMLGGANPEQWYIREIPGFLLLGAYFIIIPGILAKTWFKSFYQSMGVVRYSVMIFLFLSMILLPIKMVLRWTINLKYFVHIDEFFFNI